MAYAFRAAGTANTNNLSSTGTTALPAGTASGDLLIAVLSVAQGGSGSTVPTISTPSGWTAAPSTPLINQTTNAGITFAVYYRWATGSDTGPSWAFGSTFKYAARVFAWSGGPGSGTPAITYGNGQSGSSSTSITAPTDTASSQWFAETYSERSTTNTSFTTPSGTTLRGSQFGSGGAAADLLLVDSNGTASGTVGGDTTTAGTAASWGVTALIVFPAGAFTGTGTVSETATIAGSGSGTGTGSVTESAAIAGSGSANYTKTGSQTVTATVAGSGGGTGAGSVAAVAAIAGSGKTSGTGAVTVTATIAGSAAGAFSSTGAVTATAAIAGTGKGSGTGAVTASAAIAGSGVVGLVGTGAVTVTAAIAGSGPTTAFTGTGAVNVSATIAGQTYYFNDAEDGTNGASVVAGTGTSADGSTQFGVIAGAGSLTYDNTHVLDGSLSFKMTSSSGGASRAATWFASQMAMGTPQYISELLYMPSLPTSFQGVALIYNTSAVMVCRIYVLSSGKIEITDASGANVGVSTTAVTAGSTFRLELAVLATSATVGQLQFRIFTNPYGTTPTETITTAATVNTTALPPGQIQTGTTGPANYTYYFDQFRASPNGYPPAPSAPNSTGGGSLTASASITGSGVLGFVGSGSASATASIAGSGSAPTSNSGAVNVTASITGNSATALGGSLTETATITGAGRTTSTATVTVAAAITGSGVLATSYTPRTATSGSSNGHTVATTLPTGVTAGDLLLCKLTVSQGGTSFTQPTVSTPSGWTLIPPAPGSSNPLVSQGASAGIVGAWYYRWATGSNTAPSWTLNASVNFKYAWVVEAYSGGPGSGAPRGIFGTGATGGTPTGGNTTDTTAITAGTWYAETYSERSTTNAAYTNPSGRTRRAAVFGTGGAAVDLLWVDSGGPISGTVGADTATDDGTASSWQIHGLIVFPAAVSASITASAVISGSGLVSGGSVNALNAAAVIAGNGVVTGANPGLFVQLVVKPTYTLQLVDAPHLGTSSAIVGDLQMASQRSLVLNTPDASTLTWTMPGAHPESQLTGGAGVAGLWEMCTDAIIWRDVGLGPMKLARLRVFSSQDAADNSGDAVTVTWNAADYKAVFASRLVLEGDKGTVSSGGLSFPASTDVASIAWDLVNANQGKTNGNMGITKSLDGWTGGGTANTGKSFGSTFIVTPGTDLKTALDTLLAGDTSTPAGAAGGFDWWIDEELALHIKARNQVSPNPPGRGNASVFVADYHGTVQSFTRTSLIDQYANVQRADGATTPSLHTSPTLATDVYGRVERTITVSVNSTQTTAQQDAVVAQVGAEALYIANQPAASYSLALTQGVYDPSQLGVGDNVQVVIEAGRLDVNALQRVLSLTIAISDDGGEQVTLTTSRPDVSHWVADQLAKLGARIKGQELRQ